MSEPFAQPVNPLQQGQERQRKIYEDMRQRESQLILEVFNGPHGDALLKFWDEIYVTQPVIIPNKEGEANQFFSAQREGRNEFIRAIKRVVKNARSGDGNNTSGTNE